MYDKNIVFFVFLEDESNYFHAIDQIKLPRPLRKQKSQVSYCPSGVKWHRDAMLSQRVETNFATSVH